MADKFAKQLTAIKALVAGFTAGLPGGATTFVLANTSYTQPNLLTMLGSLQSILAAVPAAELTHAAALKVREENQGQITSVLDNATAALRGALGSSPVALAPYGVKPYKARTPLTSEQSVARAAKAAATRKARGTLGKKQKSLIKGTVPVAPVTPALPTSPALATPAATPKGP